MSKFLLGPLRGKCHFVETIVIQTPLMYLYKTSVALRYMNNYTESVINVKPSINIFWVPFATNLLLGDAFDSVQICIV